MFGKALLGTGSKGVDLTEGQVAHYLLNNNIDDSFGAYDNENFQGATPTFEGDSMKCNADGGFRPVTPLTDIAGIRTVSLWVFVTASTDAKSIYYYNNDGEDISWDNFEDILIAFGVDANMHPYIVSQSNNNNIPNASGNNGPTITDSGVTIEENSWHHYLLITDGKSYGTFYFDGALVGTSTIGSNVITSRSDSLQVGFYWREAELAYVPSYAGFVGSYSNLRIYDGAKEQTFIDALFAEGYYPKPLPLPTTNGLLAHLKLTGTAEDETGNYDGTENGGLTYVDDSEFGSVANFDGVDDYVDTGFKPPISIFSISLWVNLDVTDNRGYISTCKNTDTDRGGFLIATSSGNLAAVVYGVDGALSVTTPIPSVGTWTHVVLTYNNGNFSLYVNNVLIGSNTKVITFFYSNMWLGSYYNTLSTLRLDGKERDYRLYNTVLSAQERTDIYNYEKNFRPIDIDDKLIVFYPLSSNSLDNYKNQYDATDANVTYDGLSALFNGSTSTFRNTIAGSSITSGNVTFSIWAKATNIPTAFEYLLAQSGSGERNRGIGFGVNKIVGFSRDSAGNYKNITHTLTDTEMFTWNHYVVIDRGTVTELYMNGQFITSLDRLSNYTFSSSIAVGSNPFDLLDFHFDGRSALARVIGKAISVEQVAVIYNTEKGDFGL